MSEEEILKYIKDEIENEIDTFHWFDNTPKNETRRQIEESIKAHQGLLDLYNKEKILAKNHKTAFEKQTENLHEIENLYKKEKLNTLNLSEQLNKEKENNKELFEEYNKRVATIIEYEQVINEIIDKIYEKYTDISEVVEDLEKLLKRE